MVAPKKQYRLTRERLQQVLKYDPLTGDFTWLVTLTQRWKAGMVAGNLSPGKEGRHGYVRICIDGERIQAHRLAWFYMTGEWPTVELDHRNLVRHDNRWDNLRPADRFESLQHRKMKPGATGLRGVTQVASGRFKAKIVARGVIHNLGLHDTAQAAHSAYVDAQRRLHGEFAVVA